MFKRNFYVSKFLNIKIQMAALCQISDPLSILCNTD